jgi:hypothetical protein
MTAAATKKQWNADQQGCRGRDDPDRESDIDHDTHGYDGDDPYDSVTHGETALHACVIGLWNIAS